MAAVAEREPIRATISAGSRPRSHPRKGSRTSPKSPMNMNQPKHCLSALLGSCFHGIPGLSHHSFSSESGLAAAVAPWAAVDGCSPGVWVMRHTLPGRRNRPGGTDQPRATTSRAFTKAARAASRSSRVSVADICVRIRALPAGTTG